MFELGKTPYSLSSQATQQIAERLKEIESRVVLLRNSGQLNQSTIIDYYGRKRFEQVAESNAIEGSTLDAGETEIAVMKGLTITGHDPAFVRDAIALDRALQRAVELAKQKEVPLNLAMLLDIHELLLGGRPGAGMLRKERVRITGSNHTPPKTYSEVLRDMEEWEAWSITNLEIPAPIRSAVLHAWLAHIHPFVDGNGRSARAVSNIELIRAGYPPIIIRKKDRDRYIEALSDSGDGGDIAGFLELILEKVNAALTGLELSAQKTQGYNPVLERLRMQQAQQVQIWNTAVNLLSSMLELELSRELQAIGGVCKVRQYDSISDVEDLLEVCAGRTIPTSWAFKLSIQIPGLPSYDRLSFVGHRTSRMYNYLGQEGGPSLFWSHPNPTGYPKWIKSFEASPFGQEMTTKLGKGDEWSVLMTDGKIVQMTISSLVSSLRQAILKDLVAEPNNLPSLSSTLAIQAAWQRA